MRGLHELRDLGSRAATPAMPNGPRRQPDVWRRVFVVRKWGTRL